MEPAISEKELDIQVKILAKRISDEHRNDPTPVVLVCILNGAFMFFSDLVKQITVPIEVDFIRCRSYYGKKQGDLSISKDLETVTPVVAIYKENVDFEKVLHILYQDSDSIFDPWYIGYGMDDEHGHNRNLKTIYSI